MEFIRAKWEDVTALIESRVVYLFVRVTKKKASLRRHF